jgi:hypothetical protein
MLGALILIPAFVLGKKMEEMEQLEAATHTL